MNELVQHWVPLLRDLPLLVTFLMGVGFSEWRATKRAAADAASRKAQGERLGEVEKIVAALAASGKRE